MVELAIETNVLAPGIAATLPSPSRDASGAAAPTPLGVSLTALSAHSTAASARAATLFSSKLRLTRTVADWLAQRGFADAGATERFLNPRLSELSSPEKMADRGLAAERLARAIRHREKIVIFGDYDCDGMTAAAILTEMLRAMGGEVVPLIATRFDGGYGLSAAALKRVFEARPSVLVTCDCGSSDHERLAELGSRGVDAIVVDHHLVPDQALPALAFLNPHRRECGFEYKGLASCGLVLTLGAAVRAVLGQKLDLRTWLDLVAIGTIADVAPLDGDNRALVRAGLRALAQPQRPGLRALMQLAKLDHGDAPSSEDISFRLAPRLNAPGRLGSPDASLELLLARTNQEAELCAARLEQASMERKAQQERLLAEALEEITREGYDERAAIAIGREGWNHGIVGIVAGRLAERFQRPVVVIGFEGGVGRGSVRGPCGSKLHDALSECESSLVRFGGHQAAAGVELRLQQLAEFREAFEAAVGRTGAAAPASSARAEVPCVRLVESDEPSRVLADLALLEPCGLGNPVPALLVEALVVTAREVTGGHLKLELELDSGRRFTGFGVGMGPQAATLSSGSTPRASLIGRLRADRYRGGNAVELFVERIL